MTESTRPLGTYNVYPSVAYVQAVLANVKAKTGRTVEEWSDLVRAAIPADPKAWLKADGLGSTQPAILPR